MNATPPDLDRLLRWDAAAPRYTSYPTAPSWASEPGDGDWTAALGTLGPDHAPVSVYTHVPFCREQCWFCGCNMAVAGRQDAGDRYLDALQRQIEGLPLGADTVPTDRIHLGGGTPTWLDERQLTRLFALIRSRFPDRPGAEVSVEIDPDVTSDERLLHLLGLGLTRVSLGVQSFDPTVLTAIGRPQDSGRIHALAALARQHGLRGLNLDLVYGLPHQDEASLLATLDETVALGPDRIALYGFAFVPWVKPHQRRLDASALPGPAARARLYLAAEAHLVDAGYVRVGLDHFARPDDDLALAAAEGRLHRNFMGYTTRGDLDVVGLGVSAISDIDGIYAQQRSKLGAWYRAVDGDEPVIEKGIRLTPEDRLRRDVISRLMCNLAVDIPAVERAWGVPFWHHFADARPRLQAMADEDLLTVTEDRIAMTDAGRMLVRNAAMAFDGHLGEPVTGPRFSRAV